jgi:hypothetical protein
MKLVLADADAGLLERATRSRWRLAVCANAGDATKAANSSTGRASQAAREVEGVMRE